MFSKKDKKLDENIYKIIAENTGDLIALTKFSPKAEFIYINPAYKAILNYDSKDLIGKSGFTNMHPKDKLKLTPLLLKYLKNKAMYAMGLKQEKIYEKMEFRLQSKDGKWLTFESTANIAGEYLLFVSKDITEKKEIEKKIKEEKQFTKEVINSLPGSFYLINKKFNFVRWNDNFKKVIERSEKEMGKISPLDLFEGKDVEKIKKAIEKGFQEDYVEVEASLVTKHNKKVPYFFNGVKINFKGDDFLVGMGLDVSRQKRQEKELLEKNEYLEKMNKATIDRELKMIELKKKIKGK